MRPSAGGAGEGSTGPRGLSGKTEPLGGSLAGGWVLTGAGRVAPDPLAFSYGARAPGPALGRGRLRRPGFGGVAAVSLPPCVLPNLHALLPSLRGTLGRNALKKPKTKQKTDSERAGGQLCVGEQRGRAEPKKTPQKHKLMTWAAMW